MNRCVVDPYHQTGDKLAGHSCANNYECLSKKCGTNSTDLGKRVCQGSKESEECLKDQDCSVGLFCDEDVCRKLKEKDGDCYRDE